MSDAVNNVKSAGGFLEWKGGQTPNVGLMYLSLLCCGIPMIFQFHHFRNVLKEEFGVDDSMHWLAVIFNFYGFYLSYKQLKELEDARGITAPSAMPWWISLIFCISPFCVPVMLAKLMERLNVLIASKQQ